MKLERLKLRDVLSHESADVELGETLTVFTGASDSGKSGILRGLDQTLRNRPAGIDLLRHAAKRGSCSEFTVEGTEDGKPLSVLRRRGKSRNEYELDGQPLLAFGQEVPVEVSSRLKLSAHAFQLQSDGSFMLCETDGQVAKMLSSTVGLAQIDAAFSHVRRLKTANDTALACAEADEKREKDALERFSGLADAEEKTACADALDERWKATLLLYSEADKLAFRFSAVPRGTEAGLKTADGALGIAFDLWEMWRDTVCAADDAGDTLGKIECLPEDVSRRLRSAKAALLGAAAAEAKAGESVDLVVAAEALLSRISRIAQTANLVPAEKAIARYESAKRAFDEACALAGLAQAVLRESERVSPCDGKAFLAANAELHTFELRDNEHAAAAPLVTELEDACARLVRLEYAIGEGETAVRSLEKEITEYRTKNKVCPECGAEQKHWAKGE